jgi:hypothetical protein
MAKRRGMTSGMKALHEDLVARGELPDIKGRARA